MNLSEIRKFYKELENSWEIQSIFRWKYKKNKDNIDWKDIEYKVNKYSKGLKSDDIKSIIEQNKNALRLKLLSRSNELNKWKKVALKKFINNYISKLTILQDQEFLSKLNYYLDFYELHNSWWNDKLDFDILENHNSFSKAEIMFELLYSSTILPDYKNQKQFNSEMKDFLFRLEDNISWIKENSTPINFNPINPAMVWNYMDDMSTYSIWGSKQISKWIIKNISYKFHLWQKIDVNEFNEFSFSFLIEDSIISREEFIRHLVMTLQLPTIWNNEFAYWSDNNFNFAIYVKENFHKSTPYKKLEDIYNQKWDFESLWFEFSIYANSKKDLEPENELANACYSMPRVAESILNELFSTYKNDKSDIYPEKKEYFDLINYLNFNEDHWENITNSEEMWFVWLSNPTNLNSKNVWKLDNLDIKKIWLDDLIIGDKLKKEILRLVKIFKNRDFFIEHWWKLPNWILLYWLPWGWKTTIAKILANESDAWFFIVEPNIQWEYVWQSENNLKNRIDQAKEHVDKTWKNAIIFIDESENLFPMRGDKNHKEWMLAVLLTEMDWINEKYKWKITYVFATNRKDILDPALLSRIDKNLEIPMPSESELEQIIDLHIRQQMKLSNDRMYEHSDIDIPKIAKVIKWKSGRFVMKLIENSHNEGLEYLIDNEKFTITTELILWAIKFTEVEEQKDKEMWFKIK